MWLQLAAAVGEQLFNEVIVDSFIPKDKSVEAILDHVTPQLRELLTNDDLKANVDKPATVTDSPPAASPRDASEVAPKVEYAAYNAVVEAPQGADSALYSAPPAVFKQVAIACLFDVLFLLRVAKWKKDFVKNKKLERTEQLPYYKSLQPDSDEMKEVAYAIIKDTYQETPFASTAKGVVDQLMAAKTIPATAEVMPTLAQLHKAGLEDLEVTNLATFTPFEGNFTDANPSEQFTFTQVSHPDRLNIRWPARHGKRLVGALMKIAQNLRREQKDPSFLDFVAFHFGYLLLAQGRDLPTQGARFLGTPGFRKDFQTYLSLTDPGDGHVHGTTRKLRWMKGAIVHVEHLERPKDSENAKTEAETGRPEIETYRIPSILDFATVRLHTGNEAPNTMFVGRVMRDGSQGNFGNDFIKAAGTTAATATGIFKLGSAECKIAMEGLTTKQMVAYMQTVKAGVLRKPRQYLSAAFNINTKMTDDLILDQDGQPRLITERMDIALRGIELAAMGGFDKMTFDGATLVYPSVPFTLQLKPSQTLKLVHEAHSVGLTTYFSAGFKFENIKDAVFTGVDGIGIGGAQVLRYMDHETGMHGPYTEENIDHIMVERANAENSIRGRGAHLLVRLDQMHFEGSLTLEEVRLRDAVYAALSNLTTNAADPRNEDFFGEPALYALLEDSRAAKAVLALQDDGEQPMLGYAKRLLRADNVVLRQGDRDGEWEQFAEELRWAVGEKDEEEVRSMYAAEPWVGFRARYRAAIGESNKFFRGEPYMPVKQTPDGSAGAPAGASA